MKDLKNYITRPYWDGHIHLAGDTNIAPIAIKNVVLSNNSLDTSTIDDLLKWQKEHPQDIVLANGKTPELLKYALRPEHGFKGIGELIVKKKEGDIPRCDKLNYNILETALEDGRPIYVHHDLDDAIDNEKLERYIEKNPDVKINICHLGCNSAFTKSTNTLCLMRFEYLQKKYPNVWGDISWVTLDLLLEHEFLSKLDPNRIIIGSDLYHWSEKSPTYITGDIRKNQMLYFERHINNDRNIKQFFGISDIPRWM